MSLNILDMDREYGHLSLPVKSKCCAKKLNIMTIGESGIGKSCLVKKYCEGKVNCILNFVKFSLSKSIYLQLELIMD